MNGEIDS